MKSRSLLILVFVIALLGGFLYIILNNRPIDVINSSPQDSTKEAATYSMTDVALHATQADCWSAVNGSVYDLTSWVERHPGGPGFIIKMCGTDSSAAFTKKHGMAPNPQAALLLLKIGELK